MVVLYTFQKSCRWSHEDKGPFDVRKKTRRHPAQPSKEPSGFPYQMLKRWSQFRYDAGMRHMAYPVCIATSIDEIRLTIFG